MEEVVKDKPKRHVSWDYCSNGIDSSIEGKEANEIIEEILTVIKAHKLTVQTAKQLLEDTISSIHRETLVT